MKKLLEGLNNEQREAVTHDKGPLLIVAGAGTGKTTVITRRIAYLIASKKALPSEILALTFTDKAAGEMEERVDELVPYGFVDAWISTFHAFGDRILRDHALDLGLTTDFRVLSKPEQVIFMQDNLAAFDLKYFSPLGNPYKHIEALLDHFSKLKDETISPAGYLNYAEKAIVKAKDSEEKREAEKCLEIANSYERYQDLMAEAGNIDFGDQINIVITLFREQPSILKKYQKQFKYILVDEFQDTNYAQNELLKLLGGEWIPASAGMTKEGSRNDSGPSFTQGSGTVRQARMTNNEGNITVVGDDDQSIYRFRGAAVSNIIEFSVDFPGCKQIVLTENYRSTQAILDAAYKLIKHNNPDRLEVKNNIVKELKSKFSGESIPPIHIHTDTLTSETDAVAKKIKEYFENGKYSFKDMAILARAKGSAEEFIHTLNHYGIPFKFSGSSGLYSRPEIRILINFARLLVSSGENLAFYHLITSDVYGMDVSEAVKLNEESHKSKHNLERTANQIRKGGFWTSQNDEGKRDSSAELSRSSDGVGMTESSREILERFLADIENFREESKKMTAGQILYLFLKETGYLTKLVIDAEGGATSNVAATSDVAQVAIQNIAKFFERIGDFEKVSEDKSIINFVHHLKALMEAGEDPAMAEVDPDLEAVSILTVHGSKGLEFPVVFLVSLVSDKFPTRKRAEQLPIPDELIKESLPEGDWHLQEERRLFYVGMTRAKEILYLTSADDYGGKRVKKLSQFVQEALDRPSISKEKVKLNKVEVIERFKKREETLIPKKFYNGKKTLVLNPHQIDDYLSCPKKFEFRHILNLPIMTHHSVVYGSAIHKAIEYYYLNKIQGKKIGADDLIKVFENSWVSEGFITRDHEDKRKKQGIQSLRQFFEREEAGKDLPEAVEAKFEVKLKDLDVKIKGRFDAVYVKGQTSNGKCEKNIRDNSQSNSQQFAIIEISDFKTSAVETQEKADDKAKKNRQLSVYALAKQAETGVIPLVSLYFVDSGILAKVEKKEKDLDKTKKEIEKVVTGIKSENFKAAPGFEECSRCAYAEICPFTLSK